MMQAGFTGTRGGMTAAQKASFTRLMELLRPAMVAFHHGDCVGADAEADAIVRAADSRVVIVIHPPSNQHYQAFCERGGDVVQPPAGYLERNHRIVDACDLLIACPRTATEEVRSGTWATVRYALKLNKRVLIVFPDGSWHKPPDQTEGG